LSYVGEVVRYDVICVNDTKTRVFVELSLLSWLHFLKRKRITYKTLWHSVYQMSKINRTIQPKMAALKFNLETCTEKPEVDIDIRYNYTVTCRRSPSYSVTMLPKKTFTFS